MTKTILVVEDSLLILEMLSTVIRAKGFEVVVAQDGYEALKILDSRSIDLVITDLIMPGLDGLAVARAVRGTPPYQSTPILMLTTSSDAQLKREGRDAGITCWVSKPFFPKNLTTMIRRILGTG
jgi:two-component system, chemotaxis family, chemotaxis protein CheY